MFPASTPGRCGVAKHSSRSKVFGEVRRQAIRSYEYAEIVHPTKRGTEAIHGQLRFHDALCQRLDSQHAMQAADRCLGRFRPDAGPPPSRRGQPLSWECRSNECQPQITGICIHKLWSKPRRGIRRHDFAMTARLLRGTDSVRDFVGRACPGTAAAGGESIVLTVRVSAEHHRKH